MSEQLYDIYFKGESLEGFAEALVRQNIGQLFKAPPEKVQQLFSGKVIALKKGLDKTTALKFQAALKKAGAKIYIKQASAAQPASAAAQPANAPQPVQQAKPTTTEASSHAALDMLPVGSDVLTEAERQHNEAPEIDTSSIQLSSNLDEPLQQSPPAPPAPDVSHITAAEVGADVLEGVEKIAPPPAPDTGHIALGAVGEDLGQIHEEVVLPDLDLSDISLAEVGADIDPSEKKAPPHAPDTSHIEMEKQQKTNPFL